MGWSLVFRDLVGRKLEIMGKFAPLKTYGQTREWHDGGTGELMGNLYTSNYVYTQYIYIYIYIYIDRYIYI